MTVCRAQWHCVDGELISCRLGWESVYCHSCICGPFAFEKGANQAVAAAMQLEL